VNYSPLLPQNISELLPSVDDKKSFKSLFVTIGPALVDALSKGEDFVETCNRLRLQPTDAFNLLSAPEFISYVEAYLSIGDITDKHQRIRLVKAMLAAQIADGNINRRRDALDYISHIQKELSSSEKNTTVNVQVVNTSVPRPYIKNKEEPNLIEQK